MALVTTIWGVLGFKIVNSINPPEQAVEVQTKLVTFMPKVIKARDTFSILANYRDPFLGTLPKKKKTARERVGSTKGGNCPTKRSTIQVSLTKAALGTKFSL